MISFIVRYFGKINVKERWQMVRIVYNEQVWHFIQTAVFKARSKHIRNIRINNVFIVCL